MTSFEFNSANIENSVTFNNGISQVVGNYCNSTMKKDFSIVKLSNKMKVKVQGKILNKKVVAFFTKLGYSITGFSDVTEDYSYYHYIFTKA